MLSLTGLAEDFSFHTHEINNVLECVDEFASKHRGSLVMEVASRHIIDLALFLAALV